MNDSAGKLHRRKELKVDQRYLILPQSVHPSIDQYQDVIKNLDMKKSIFWPLMYREEPDSELTVKVEGHTLFAQPMAMSQSDPVAWAGMCQAL